MIEYLKYGKTSSMKKNSRQKTKVNDGDQAIKN